MRRTHAALPLQVPGREEARKPAPPPPQPAHRLLEGAQQILPCAPHGEPDNCDGLAQLCTIDCFPLLHSAPPHNLRPHDLAAVAAAVAAMDSARSSSRRTPSSGGLQIMSEGSLGPSSGNLGSLSLRDAAAAVEQGLLRKKAGRVKQRRQAILVAALMLLAVSGGWVGEPTACFRA